MALKLKVRKRHAAKSKPPKAVWRATNHTYLHFKSERSFERVLEIKIPRFHWGGEGAIWVQNTSLWPGLKAQESLPNGNADRPSTHHSSKILAF